ncbi:MAG: ABC transporter permease [Sphaerochaetaceae bacterium]|nr:ABC transporter permease [Sphaerochaetaceae bacterium]
MRRNPSKSIATNVNTTVAILVLFFMLIPIIMIMVSAFNDSEFFKFPPTGFTLDWIKKFFTNPEYSKAIQISLKVSISALCLALIIGIPAAYSLFKWDSNFSDFLQSIFLSPLMLPGIVWAIGLIQYYAIIGILGSFIGLVAAHVILILPYVIRLLLSTLSYLDEDLENAAMTLGATPIRTFFEITIPSIVPGIIISSIFGFMISFNDVTISTFIAGTKYLTYPVRMYVELRTEGLDPLAVAVSAIIMFVTTIIALIAEKLWKWSQYL